MSHPFQEESEIADFDALAARKSLLFGALTTFLLSFAPVVNFLCLLNTIGGGLVCVWHYTRSHAVSVTAKGGFKLAASAVFFGMAGVCAVLEIVLLSTGGLDMTGFKESYIEQMLSSGRPEQARMIEESFPDKLRGDEAGVIFALITIPFLAALLGGAIGGPLGAALFKKGPVAQ